MTSTEPCGIQRSHTDSRSMVPPSSDRAVSNFVAQYKRERDTYRKLERLATDFCRDLVARQAIKATIASRTKQVHRLEVKAKERVWKYAKKYFTKDDVRDDIWDLVGVRINVFFPSDAGKATEIIKDSFTLVKQSSYPRSAVASPPPTQGSDDNSRPTFKRRFNGYVSDHYRVRMKEENMTEELKGKFKGFEPMMEIQVASMLMHAVSVFLCLPLYSTRLTKASVGRN